MNSIGASDVIQCRDAWRRMGATRRSAETCLNAKPEVAESWRQMKLGLFIPGDRQAAVENLNVGHHFSTVAHVFHWPRMPQAAA